MRVPIFRVLTCCFIVSSIMLYSANKVFAAGERWWDKFGEPEYGGTLTFTTSGLNAVNFDVYNFVGSENNFWLEAMFEPDWTLDRNKWAMNGMFIPDQYWKGNLAESWEIPDAKTIIVSIRKGIHWQNKPPVNGREFTAFDVQAHYDRILGTGGGYSWKAPMYIGMTSNWEKVYARDKYTVIYKFKQPSAQILQSVTDRVSLNVIEAPEWVALGGKPVPPPAGPAAGGPGPGGQQGPPPGGGGGGPGGPPPAPDFGHGPRQDWHNAVGTGPWMIERYVDGSSFTYVKNPDYWGHDPRHPKNQLPYADKLVMLIIPDMSTRIAAMRTRKIDSLGEGRETIEWQQAESIEKSNPEFVKTKRPGGAGGIGFRMDKKPFTDIRVRKAMNMAIDRRAIAKSIFHGTSDGNPTGMITQTYKGYAFDYSDWPQSLKDEYEYNPARAKELLKEAGYPNGFSTNVIAPSDAGTIGMSVMQAFKSYFHEVGIEMQIKTMDSMTAQAFTRASKHDQLSSQGGAQPFPPTRTADLFSVKGDGPSIYGLNDAKYESLRDRFFTATDPAKAAKIFQEMDRRVIEQHWQIIHSESYGFVFWQPYLKGYSGENLGWGQGISWSRLWIDKNAQK